jgi:hypothetical protein
MRGLSRLSTAITFESSSCEKDSWAKNQNLWKRMPKLAAWIDADFEKIKELGIYDVRVSRDAVF